MGAKSARGNAWTLHFWVITVETVWYIITLTLLSKNLKFKEKTKQNLSSSIPTKRIQSQLSVKKQNEHSQGDRAESIVSLFHLNLSFLITCGSCSGFNSHVVMEVGYLVHLITYLVCKSKTLCAAFTCNR